MHNFLRKQLPYCNTGLRNPAKIGKPTVRSRVLNDSCDKRLIVKLEMRFSALSICVSLAVGGCSALPRSGPMAQDVVSSGNAASRSYEIFDISPTVIAAVQQRGPSSLVRRFGDAKRSAEPTIGVGDTVSVNIWEAPGGVLFASSAITSSRRSR